MAHSRENFTFTVYNGNCRGHTPQGRNRDRDPRQLNLQRKGRELGGPEDTRRKTGARKHN
jgi:hypothetical protein